MNKFTVIAKKASFWEIVDGKQKRISKARFDAILSQKIVKTEYRENETVYHVEERETVELFSFAELSEVVQNAVIENNRYKLVADDDWYLYQKEDFHQILELLGFSNIQSQFGMSGASFTADWDAANIVNNPEKWESDKAYKHFKPYLDKLLKTCADSPELELERLRVDCCTKYYRNLLAEYNYLTSDAALKDSFGCYWLKYTKNGLLCVNGGA